MERLLRLVATMQFLGVLAGSGHAADSAWEDCAQEQDRNRGIAGCTEVLRRGSIESITTRANAFTNRGLHYHHKGDIDRAMADYNAAIRLVPGVAEAFIGRGVVYVDKGDIDRAMTDYNAAIRLNPQHADAFNNRGVAYRRKGDIDRAIADYSEAIRLNPRHAVARRNRGGAYLEKGWATSALADYEAAAQVGRSDGGTIDRFSKLKTLPWGGTSLSLPDLSQQNSQSRLRP